MLPLKILVMLFLFWGVLLQGDGRSADAKKLARLRNQLDRVSSIIFARFCDRTWDANSRKDKLAQGLQSRFYFVKNEMKKLDLGQIVCPKVYKPVNGLFEFSISSHQENKKFGQCQVKEVSNRCHLLIEPGGPAGLIKPLRIFAKS